MILSKEELLKEAVEQEIEEHQHENIKFVHRTMELSCGIIHSGKPLAEICEIYNKIVADEQVKYEKVIVELIARHKLIYDKIMIG